MGVEIPAERGFLDDPEGPFAEYLGFETVQLAGVDDAPCVILLGEAGLGKSTELRLDEARLVTAGTDVVRVDLGDEVNLDGLKATLDLNLTYAAWTTNPSRRLVLMLDSFDEAAITIAKLASSLTKLLSSISVERLSLRIVSRSSGWSQQLEEQLKAKFSEVTRLTLCPLTRNNVLMAAEAKGMNAAAFLSDIESRDLSPLAARPITLAMLTDLAGAGPLPTSRTQLYHDAVQRLARENSPRRQEDRTTQLPTRKRLAHARRLAALTLLAGRNSLRVHHPSASHDNYLILDDIAETGDERDELEEVLQSGLFTASDGGTVKFAHRSIAEYLAAETLAEMPVRSAARLLTDPEYPDQIVPQLAGVAIWTAALNADFYAWLAAADPELLLTPNLITATEDQRRVLGKAITADLDANVPPRDRRYFWLSYDGLADDVAPYLDDDRDWRIRVEAAHILSNSGCHELDERLVQILETIAARRDPDYRGDDTRLATSLIYALGQTTDPALLGRLIAIADDASAPEDVRAEIVGELWGRVSTPTLLNVLTAAKVWVAAGSMPRMIASELATAVERGQVELDALVDWLDSTGLMSVDQPPSPARQSDVEWHTVVQALAQALTAQDSDVIDDEHATAIAKGMLASQCRTYEFTPDRRGTFAAERVEGRRRLAGHMLAQGCDNATCLHMAQSGLVSQDDLAWLLDRLARGPANPDEFEATKLLAGWFIAADDPAQEQLARDTVAGNEAATAWVNSVFSAQAKQIAADQRQDAAARAAKDAAAKTARDFDPVRLDAAIAARDWCAAARELTRPIENDQWSVGAGIDQGPGWAKLDTSAQAQVIALAAEFLAGLPVTLTPEQADDAGFAYALVRERGPNEILAPGPDTLVAWLDAIRRVPAQDEAVAALVNDLRGIRANQLSDVLVEAIHEDGKYSHSIEIRKLGTFTSKQIEDALYDLATDRNTSWHVVRAAAEALLVRDPDRAVRTVYAIARQRPAARPTGSLFAVRWRQAVYAVAALASSSALPAEFDRLMKLFADAPDLAEDVVSATGDRIGANSSWSALSSDQLATLYLWARRALPQAPEYAPGAIMNVNPVHDFPNNIFNALVARETTDAVEAIERIAAELNEGWPRRSAADVARRIRGAEWTPMAIADADDILANPDHRVVTSEPQLARAFLDAIDDVTAEVKRNPDVAATFWDKQAGQPSVWRPVDEDTFTTRLVARMQDRLTTVVLRQEAQLNYHIGATTGSYPDLEAIAVTGGVTLSVAGEAKGIWHKDVTTSIETQLAARYVTGVRTNTGIYVVGFFSSDKWDPEDYRRAKANKYDLDEFRAGLEKQARELSKDGKTVHVRVIPIRI